MGGGVVVGLLSRAGGLALVDPGAEILGCEVRESQQQIAQVPLGIDDDEPHTCEQATQHQEQDEKRFSRPGLAGNHNVVCTICFIKEVDYNRGAVRIEAEQNTVCFGRPTI